MSETVFAEASQVQPVFTESGEFCFLKVFTRKRTFLIKKANFTPLWNYNGEAIVGFDIKVIEEAK